MLKLYNSLSRNVEEFTPINPPHVGMYACGPTVHDYAHIGNFRSFVFYDILRRTLQADGYEVTFVQNITDVEDKIIKKAAEKNMTIGELTTQFTHIFFQDLDSLNILPANVSPKATEHITKMIKFIEELIQKGLAYTEEDGSVYSENNRGSNSVYFDISKFPEYGKLSQLDKRELKTGTRILSDEYSKENVQDFALWKGVKADEMGWDSPWGKGRPGWHIECSVMSQEYLGDTFDIHTGGIDLLFPHHENEIAQSEGKTGKQFVRYWVHGEHILVDNQKMSKSLHNFFTLQDVKEKGFEPLAFRYLVLTAHYRDKMNFTWESLQSAQNALNNLREIVREFRVQSSGFRIEDNEYYQKFMQALHEDLNTSQALATMWALVKSDLSPDEKAAIISKMDQVLGLQLDDYIGKQVEIPEEVQKLVEQREQARLNKDFKKSDELRDQIKELGFEVKDTPQGAKLKKL